MHNHKALFKLLPILTVVVIALPLSVAAQDRSRVVPDRIQDSPARSEYTRRPGLTNKIVIRSAPKLKKTGSSKAVKSSAASAYMTATTKAMMMEAIREKIGIRYRYATAGPSTYDCSGFVWKVFNDAGIPVTRTSAKVFWRTYQPVSGDDRFAFGTLVFFNGLGHVGIVANKEGFYHASSSRGVTYSRFEGYWSKRIVGFRRIPIEVPTWSDVREADPTSEN